LPAPPGWTARPSLPLPLPLAPAPICRTCGSIMSGQRLPRVTSTPLSTDTSSAGRPARPHSRSATGEASTPHSVTCSETGMPSASQPATQLATSCCLPGIGRSRERGVSWGGEPWGQCKPRPPAPRPPAPHLYAPENAP
jgi:hypothetical protein